MKKSLESINSELFNAFNPEDELWVVGGSKSVSGSGSVTSTPNGPDGGGDVDVDWSFAEEPELPGQQ